jgi:hypothetical protein
MIEGFFVSVICSAERSEKSVFKNNFYWLL